MKVICIGQHCDRPFIILEDDLERPATWNSFEAAEEALDGHILIQAAENAYLFDLETGEYEYL